MSVYLNKKRQKWAYTFRIDGERFAGYCEDPETGVLAKNKTEAKKVERAIRAKVQKLLDEGKKAKEEENKKAVPKGGFTLVEPLTYYLNKMKGKASFNTAKGYTEELLDFFGRETPMQDVEEKIEDYIEFSKKQKVKYWKGKDENGNDLYGERDKLRSNKTINEYLNFLVRSYRAFKKAPSNKKIRKYIPNPPEFEHLEVYKRTPTPIPMSVAEKYLDAFDEVLHAHTKLAYIICEQTGMRARECAQIKERQYHEAERRILLEAEQTKSKAGRFFPVNDIAHQALIECRKVGDYLWKLIQEYPHLAAEYAEEYGIKSRMDINFILYRPKGTGVPRPVKHVSTSAWKAVKKKVGINYRWHDTRATFCSETLGASGDISAVQQIAGHQDITTTQKYLLASDQRLKRSVDALALSRPVDIPVRETGVLSKKALKALEERAAA